jgi:hypothetical protein
MRGSSAVAALATSLLMVSGLRVAWCPDADAVNLHTLISWSTLHVASLVFVFGALGRALIVGRALRAVGGAGGSTAAWATAALQVSVEPGPWGVVATLVALGEVASMGVVQPAGLVAWTVSVGLLAVLLACLALTASLVANLGEGLALGVAWTPVLYLFLRCGLADATGFSPADLLSVTGPEVATGLGLLGVILGVGLMWYWLWHHILGHLMAELPARGGDHGLPLALAQVGLLTLLASFSAGTFQSGEERMAWFHVVTAGLGLICFCGAYLVVSTRHACLRRQGAGEVLATMPVGKWEWAALQARWTVVPALLYAAACLAVGETSRWLLHLPTTPDRLWMVLPMAVAGLVLGFGLHPAESLSERVSIGLWTDLARGVRIGLVGAAVLVGLHLAWHRAVMAAVDDGRPPILEQHVMWSQTVGQDRLLSEAGF